MGKLLFVDLSTRKITEETPEESLYRDFIGGPGIGARVLYSRQKAGVDALGPENTLGLITGPLTGTPNITGVRYQVVAKSPLTGGWGDANSGGDFGPHLKFAGYDAVFFNGIADKPVYLLIDNGKAQLKDAAHLWSKDTYETEDTLIHEYGKDSSVSCIGPAGEKLSRIACLVNKRGSVAGRCGLGAVMGSKKLKAVVARGNMEVPIADKEKAAQLRKENMAELRSEGMRKYGTSSMAARSALSGDSPVKNWGGVGIIDYSDTVGVSGDAAIMNFDRHDPCWHCPIACQALLKAGTGEYRYPAGVRRIEYETQAAFGMMCLNHNAESLNMLNHLCNSYGIDTISAGGIIAFAIECYENGIITGKDTGGIELTWGNHRAIVAMTEKMVKREGFGEILADGVKIAAERIGKGAEQYAIHIGGQELGYHDPKLAGGIGDRSSTAARYQMDAAPGRHTAGFGPGGFSRLLNNALGVCTFGSMGPPGHRNYLVEFMNAVTGLERSMDELLRCGERIANMRHVFTLREGINPLKLKVHSRIIGDPPQKVGPLADVRAPFDAQNYWNLGALDWDWVTTKPSKAKLLSLGLKDVAEEIWPPSPLPGGPGGGAQPGGPPPGPRPG